MKQKKYNKAKIKAYTKLLLNFNLCQRCFKYVCDDCFDASDDTKAVTLASLHSKLAGFCFH